MELTVFGADPLANIPFELAPFLQPADPVLGASGKCAVHRNDGGHTRPPWARALAWTKAERGEEGIVTITVTIGSRRGRPTVDFGNDRQKLKLKCAICIR